MHERSQRSKIADFSDFCPFPQPWPPCESPPQREADCLPARAGLCQSKNEVGETNPSPNVPKRPLGDFDNPALGALDLARLDAR